ncbi:MAG: 30S ribosomal protein S17e [Candidatus Nanoarchaeia archaeon]
MGRIRPGFVKRQAQELLTLHQNKFSSNFESNKKVLNEIAEFPTKKLRNLIAGYITKEMKKAKIAKMAKMTESQSSTEDGEVKND